MSESPRPHSAENRLPTQGSNAVSSTSLETRRLRRDRWLGRLAMVQGAFYAATGVWPIVHIRSFLAVTGPKTDLWLVQTVGALLMVMGLVLWRAGVRRAVTADLVMLASGCALALAIVDLVFVTRDVISPIYLLDAAAELALVFAWIVCTALNRRQPGES